MPEKIKGLSELLDSKMNQHSVVHPMSSEEYELFFIVHRVYLHRCPYGLIAQPFSVKRQVGGLDLLRRSWPCTACRLLCWPR